MIWVCDRCGDEFISIELPPMQPMHDIFCRGMYKMNGKMLHEIKGLQ